MIHSTRLVGEGEVEAARRQPHHGAGHGDAGRRDDTRQLQPADRLLALAIRIAAHRQLQALCRESGCLGSCAGT